MQSLLFPLITEKRKTKEKNNEKNKAKTHINHVFVSRNYTSKSHYSVYSSKIAYYFTAAKIRSGKAKITDLYKSIAHSGPLFKMLIGALVCYFHCATVQSTQKN